MLHILNRVQLAFIGIFFAACLGVFAYEALYVWPVRACESRGDWWDPKDHACATPMPIWRFTGRLPKAPPAPPHP